MKLGLLSMALAGTLFAAVPSSSSYQLHNYGFGSGSTSNSSSANYSLNATTGEVSNTQSTSSNYSVRSGNNNAQQAHVPVAPTFDNPSNYYNKLHFAITPGANPSDTLFSIAISTDGFATQQYIQNDNTVGAARGIEDYQSYAAWGGAAGQVVTGLTYGTTYQIRVNSFQGKFTETAYGPAASAATVPPSITFDIDVSPTDTETNPPYTTTFGSLLPATVTNATSKVWIDLDTNAVSGAKVYLGSTNGGLKSTQANFTLASATADLSGAATGYGAQGSTAGQGSGGPLSISAPYNVSGQNVGIVNSTVRELFSTSLPITSGRGSVQFKAKAAATTPAAGDYQDSLTLTAAASF